MLKQILKCKMAIILCLALVLCSPEAFAWGGGRGGGRDGGHGGSHYYRDGRWYRHGWFGFDIAVTALAIGALVDSLPPRHATVIVGGVPYYYYDDFYYRTYPGGYVVVPPPVVTQPIVVAPEQVQFQQIQQAQTAGTVTINIPNARGGYTAITLRRSGNGFIGPQGEYYSEHPTVAELKTLYGN